MADISDLEKVMKGLFGDLVASTVRVSMSEITTTLQKSLTKAADDSTPDIETCDIVSRAWHLCKATTKVEDDVSESDVELFDVPEHLWKDLNADTNNVIVKRTSWQDLLNDLRSSVTKRREAATEPSDEPTTTPVPEKTEKAAEAAPQQPQQEDVKWLSSDDLNKGPMLVEEDWGPDPVF